MKYLVIIVIFLLPALALAQGVYKPLVGIPGVDPDADFNSYINTLYALSIGIAALLAVIKIIIAGVKWMMTDIVSSKSEAKKDIEGALLGLLIVLGAVLIITVINPDILKVNLNLNKVEIPVYQATPGVSANGAPIPSTNMSVGPASGSSPAGAPSVLPAVPPGYNLFLGIPPTLKNNCLNIDSTLCAADPGGIDCFEGVFSSSGSTYTCAIPGG